MAHVDPVLEYAKILIKFIGRLGLELGLPKNFAKYPDEDLRMWIHNLEDIAIERNVLVHALSLPRPKGDLPSTVRSEGITLFLKGGPRPAIQR